MNRVSLIGRITKDPEVRYSQSGSAYVMFTLAVNRTQRDVNGQTMADFISITAFGQQAEFIGRYVKKGNQLGIAGRIQTRNYQGNDGQTRYVTEVVVDQVENLTPRDPNAQPAYQQGNGYPNQQPVRQQNYNNPSYGNQGGYSNPSYGNNGYNNPSYNAPKNDDAQPESFNVEVADDDLPF